MSLKIKVNGNEPAEVSVELKLDYPLLEILEDAGVQLPHGCRSGICGSCRVKVTNGLGDLAPRTLTESDTLTRCQDADDIRLACRATVLPSAQQIELEVAPPVVIKNSNES